MKDEERPEVFRGHLEECLRHLAKQLSVLFPPGTKNISRARKPMADFCGVGDATVRGWLVGNQSAVGTQLLKLWCFLDLIGYRLIQFERLSKVRQGIAQMIGFGVLSAADVAHFIGYASEQQVYRLFFGEDKGITGDRDEKMLEMYKAHKDVLDQARVDKYVDFPPKPVAENIPLPAVQSVLPAEVSPLQEGAIDLMQALLKMFDGGAFARVSNGSVAKLQTSRLTIVRLTIYLSKLSAQCLEL